MPWQWTSNQSNAVWGNNAWARDNGKGKGKGKGNDKEEPSGRKWSCPSEACKQHNKGTVRIMAPHLKACSCCLTPKAATEAINQTKLVELREAAKKELLAKKEEQVEAPLSKRQQKKLQNAAKKQEAESQKKREEEEKAKPGATPDTPPKPAQAATEEPKEDWAPKPLPETVTVNVGKLNDIIQRVLESVAADSYPSPKTPENLEAEIMSKLAPHQPALESTEEAEVRKELADLTALLAMGAHRMPTDVHADLVKRVENKELQLTRVVKKTKTPALQHASLVQARAAAVTACTERRERGKTGATKSATRSSERLQLISAGVQALAALMDAVKHHDSAFAEAHAARSTVVDASEQALLLKYDTKIATALGQANDPHLEAKDVDFEDAAADDAAAEELATWKAKFTELQDRQAKEAEAMQSQLEALQATHAAAMEAKTASDTAAREAAVAAVKAEADKASLETLKKLEAEARTTDQLAKTQAAASAWATTVAAFEATITVDEGAIPDFVAANAEQLEHASNLYYFLQQWSLLGGSHPFTVGDLRQQSLAKEKIVALMLALLGPNWKLIFPAIGGPTNSAVMPRQSVLVLLHALERVKTKFEGIEDSRAAAAKSLAVIVGESKKRRVAQEA